MMMEDEFETEPMLFEGALALVKSDCMEDWYTIEKAEHENKMWMKQDSPNCMSLQYTGRIADADVEGYGPFMVGLAGAILVGEMFYAKRCAVSAPKDGRVKFWSPRNSATAGSVPVERAQELAKHILETLRTEESGNDNTDRTAADPSG